MNWGYRIIILYTSFVVFMLALVSVAVKQNFDLVAPDYYRQEIEYQSRIDNINNSKKLSTPLQIELLSEENILNISYPEVLQNISGKILLYRPTDAKQDITIPVKADEKFVQQIPLNQLEKGLWRVKIQWKADEVEYYNEEAIVLN